MLAPRGCPLARLPAMLRRARVRARTTPDAWRVVAPYPGHARHNGTHRRRTLSTPALLRLPRAGEVALRHRQSDAPRAFSGREMRFRPRPSAQGYEQGARPFRHGRVLRVPP